MRILVGFGLILVGAAIAHEPPSGGPYEMIRSVIGAARSTSTGGAFSVSGTTAQHDAIPAASGGDFSVQGGLWPDTDGRPDTIFKDGYES